MIYIIVGETAIGKTTLLRRLKEMHRIDINVKGTNRAPRGEDDDVLCYNTEKLPEELYDHLTYKPGYESIDGKKIVYGVNIVQIEESLKNSTPHWLICSSLSVDRKIMELFPGKVVMIYLASVQTARKKKKIILERNADRENVGKRLECSRKIGKAYMRNRDLFDFKLVNHFKLRNADREKELERLTRECIEIMRQYKE